jgi:hypothetical protein
MPEVKSGKGLHKIAPLFAGLFATFWVLQVTLSGLNTTIETR